MNDVQQERLKKKYDAGFTTNVESVTLPPGLNENIIKQISKSKRCLRTRAKRIHRT